MLEVQYSGASHVRSATIILSSLYLGQSHRYQLKATNEIGTTQSLVGYALFAQVPDAPSAGPTSDASITNKERIKVDWSAVTATGGSEILSYQIEMDDGDGGDFVALTGEGVAGYTHYLKLSFTVYSNITEGEVYRFRYRAKNAAGWGAYSPITGIRAATVPQAPPAPQLSSVTNAAITLTLLPSTADEGSPITSYKILRDAGNSLGGAISYTTQLTNYDGSASSYSATVANDALELGKTYRFVYVAVNAYGDSEYSLPLIAGVGAPPTASAAPVRDTPYDYYNQTSGRVQMMLTW